MAIDSVLNLGKANTLTANGTYLLPVKGAKGAPGGMSTIYANGDFGGGTLTAYATPDGTDTNKFSIGTIADDAFLDVTMKSAGIILILTGSTTPTLKVWGI